MINSNNLEHIEKNSKKGSLLSLFQLFCNERTSKEPLSPQSLDLLEECILYVNSYDTNESPLNKFHLNKIQLKDFRKYKSLELNFNEKLTVLVGLNGAGKSTIIDAITKTLSWIGNVIIRESNNGRPIIFEDINNESRDYAEINSFFKFGKTEFQGNLSRAVKGSINKKDSHVSDLKQIANILRTINGLHKINLPLFCSYPVERSQESTKKAGEKYSGETNRFDAYKESLDGKLKLDDFFSNLIIINNKAQASINNNLVESLKEQINSLNLMNFENKEIINLLGMKLNEIKNITINERDNDSSEFKRYLDTIKGTLIGDILEIEDISFSSSSGKDQVYFHFSNGNIVTSKQLSHGQRVLLSLIGDICLRLLLLNPNLKNPLNGQGIILIDELELHLHPHWQQKILLALLENFPNIQFIVSTHSPQTISTIKNIYIRQLTEDNKVIEPEYQTEGVKSSDVLEQIMQTQATPDIEINSVFERFLSLIEQDLYQNEEGIALEAKLLTHYGCDHPKVKEYKGQIRLIELKKKIAKKKNG